MTTTVDYKQIAVSRMTDQHRRDEGFTAIVEAFTEILEEYQQSLIDFKSGWLSVDNSVGYALDQIGGIVGQKRELVNFYADTYFGFDGAGNEGYDVGKYFSVLDSNDGSNRVLTDEEYRNVIKARIIKNNSRGNVNDLLSVMNLITGNTSTSCLVTTHGVIDLSVTDTNGIARYFLNRRDDIDSIIPRPLGYRIKVTYI